MKGILWIVLSLILLFFGVTKMDSIAVEPGKISKTAEMTTVYRAIGSLDPDEKIRNNDTYAEKFIPRDDWSKIFPYFNFKHGYEKAIYKLKADIKFSYFFVQARTKHIDVILSESLKNGITQVVNLGAGYDSRAYRFHQTSPIVRFFEIDLPEMVTNKKERVKKIFGNLPNWVMYVPIDFNKQNLNKELLKAGFNKNQKTLFIWEGVTMYISQEAVVATLRFIADESASGSLVVFDYVSKSIVDNKNRFNQFDEGASAWGEPIIFGIEDDTVEKFISQTGLKLISDIGPLEMTNKYLIRTDCQVAGYMRGNTKIAYAVVPDKIKEVRE